MEVSNTMKRNLNNINGRIAAARRADWERASLMVGLQGKKDEPEPEWIKGRTEAVRMAMQAKTFAYPYRVSYVLDEHKKIFPPTCAPRGDIA
jgi:hypothetical protein